MRDLRTEPYVEQRARWPKTGRHVMAQFDEDSVVVYQAYRPSIGEHAAREGNLVGGGFSLERMSWIKPGFLWMMYRSGWATKPEQEIVLAIWLARRDFDALLEAAVPSTWDRERYETREAWQEAVRRSDVRVQWDPDHGPSGQPVERRAIQLGLRGRMLERFARAPLGIADITPFVRDQHARYLRDGNAGLVTPSEAVYR